MVRNNYAEKCLDAMRDWLTKARDAEREGDHERADAYGAMAANKLAVAVHIQRKVIPLR